MKIGFFLIIIKLSISWYLFINFVEGYLQLFSLKLVYYRDYIKRRKYYQGKKLEYQMMIKEKERSHFSKIVWINLVELNIISILLSDKSILGILLLSQCNK